MTLSTLTEAEVNRYFDLKAKADAYQISAKDYSEFLSLNTRYLETYYDDGGGKETHGNLE